MATQYKCRKCGTVSGKPKIERISPVDILYKCQCGITVESFEVDASDITSFPDDIAGQMLAEMYCY